MPFPPPLPRLPQLRRTITLALTGLALALPLQAETSVRAITLSTAGLAMIEASAPLGEVPLRLSVARGDIDDFLKTLWVLDPEGAVAHLTMTGPGGFEDAFAHLPLGPDEVTDPARLLRAMIGAPIAVERRGERWDGINMGVTERPCEHGPCPVLNLQDRDGSLRSFEIDDALSFTFSEGADRAHVSAALAAWRTRSDERRVDLTLRSDNTEARDIGLIWLQNAPIWRTAWRAVDTPQGIQLIGWAVVENATGLDWQDVQLTLATGATRNIAARLYERRYAHRESALIVESEQAMAPAMLARGAQGFAAMPQMADAAVAEVSADDGDSFSRFTLSMPVTLAAGQMISLPFLSETLPEARLTLYRGGRGETHPVIALAIENPLPLRLPAGVLTLYEDARGHAGDAMIPELAPGATEIVDFARDTAIEVREESGTTETLREMRLVRGMLEVTEDLERRTTYRITGAPRVERELTLDHPRRADWTVTGPEDAEETPDAWRWRISLPEGEVVTHVVTERQPRLRRVALLDIDLPVLAQWESRASNPELRALLAELAGLRGAITEATSRQHRAVEEIAELEREQARLVNLIVQLGDDSSANRDRRARVDAIDAEIAAAEATRRAAGEEIDRLRARIGDLLEE